MRLYIIMAAMLAVLPAHADTVPAEAKTFADKVTVSNKFEIDTSKLAQQYGKDSEVKKFADQMIADHEKAGVEFKEALKQAKIDPPRDALDVTHTAKYAKLRVFTTEAGFDKSYVTEQVQAHEDAVTTFKDYAAHGQIEPLKAFAAKTLPTLEHHRAMIKSIEARLNAPNS